MFVRRSIPVNRDGFGALPGLTKTGPLLTPGIADVVQQHLAILVTPIRY